MFNCDGNFYDWLFNEIENNLNLLINQIERLTKRLVNLVILT